MSNVQIPPDSTGKYIATNPVSRDGVTEQVQLIQIVDINGNLISFATATSAAAPGYVVTVGGTAAIASVAYSATSVVLLAANAARRGVIITNDSTASVLYLAYAATASLTAYTYALQPGASLSPDNVCYTGVISGIWAASGSGTAYVTEVTT